MKTINRLTIKRRAFSMVELIFVIVIMGILAKVASSYMPDNKLLNDTNFVIQMIKKTQHKAMGYENYVFGKTQFWDDNTSDFNRTCIAFNTFFLQNMDTKNYNFDALLTPESPSLCFDSDGRPYRLQGLLFQKVDINVTFNNKTNTISVLPYSGYVIIK
ncbi:MAG: type II secretion system protein [Sulfurospirillaceae bacterium]|nr:type II secretion system protein [Sulfurospirillaceae bacterium]MDD2825824.1 type II secretion system protein [Sulfurospirillaceae bacterium]